MTLNKNTILGLIREAVKYCPASMGEARPNTFAVITDISDLNEPNYGHVPDDFQGEYWTRHKPTANKLEFRPPYVCPVLFGGARTFDLGNRNMIASEDDIKILCLDRYITDKQVEQGKRRSITAIQLDTEKVINKIMEYLEGVEAYKVEYTAGQFAEGYFNKKYLDYCKTNNKIIDYTAPANLRDETNNYKAFLNLNQNLRVDLLSFPHSEQMLVGSSITIKTLSINCYDEQFDFFIDGTAINNEPTLMFGN